MDIIPLPEWEKIFNDINKNKGVVIVIGATDSGKSTLIYYLISKFISNKKIITVVDADVGQSTIGLPGTISMKTFEKESDSYDNSWDIMLYLGFINPSKNIKLVIESTNRLVNKSRELSEFIIVDTTGLVSGIYGKILKTEKIKKINPDFIIAIQKGNELEHIVESLSISDKKLYKIQPSPFSRIRSRVERIKYRINKLNNYFLKKPLNEYIVYKDSIQFFYLEKEFNIKKKDITKNTIIGLNNSEYTISLGVVQDTDNNSITFYSPIDDIKNIKKIIIGDLTIKHEKNNNCNNTWRSFHNSYKF